MRLYEVIAGPLLGLRGQMCADQGSTVVLKSARPGWMYPVYTVVPSLCVRLAALDCPQPTVKEL